MTGAALIGDRHPNHDRATRRRRAGAAEERAIRFEQTPSGTIEIYPSRVKLLGLMALSLLLIAASVLVATTARANHATLLLQAIGVFGALFFGMPALFIVVQLLSRRAMLCLSSDGIVDRSSLLAAGFVPWSDIEFVAPVQVGNTRMLGFYLKDPDSFVRRQSWVRALILRLNLRMGFPVVTVPQNMLPGRIEELAAQLATRFPVRVESLDRRDL